jgi:hypothetical protein
MQTSFQIGRCRDAHLSKTAARASAVPPLAIPQMNVTRASARGKLTNMKNTSESKLAAAQPRRKRKSGITQ